LLGDETIAASEPFKTWQTAHNGFLAAYRAADFGCAAQEMKTARDASAGRLDAYYDLFAARIAEHIKNPPPENWDGVFTAKEK
jgi:adenylate cyclase